MTVDKLIYEAIGASFEVYNAFGPVHFKQVRTYMKLLGKPAGLLVNFDVSDFKQGYKVIK